MQKITIVGTGYVGLVSGTCLAEIGNEVICCDIDQDKIDLLNNGEIPIYEPGLKELVEKNINSSRLKFTTNIDEAIKKSKVIFSAVGTPPDENHKADLKFVREVAKSFANNLNEYKIFVNKSTVPVGTCEMVKKIILENTNQEFSVVSNPEFLKEGCAVKDFLNPDRIVIGTDNEEAKKIMYDIYKPLERVQSPIIFTDIKSVELIKYAANSFLATKISFINEIAKFSDLVGADIKAISKGIGLDSRIGPKFLNAGIGYGGSCFPKDVNALVESGKEKGLNFEIISAAENVNKKQKYILIDKLEKIKDIKTSKICVLGLSFKPKTDDVREAPASYIIEKLLDKGAIINAYDPIANENFSKKFNLNVKYFNNYKDAIKDCEVLMILTEWDEFRNLDFNFLKENMKDKIIVDGRNILNPIETKENQFKYISIGRQNI